MCSRDTRSCCRCTPGQPGCSQESVHGQDGDKELQDTQDQCDQLLGPRLTRSIISYSILRSLKEKSYKLRGFVQ